MPATCEKKKKAQNITPISRHKFSLTPYQQDPTSLNTYKKNPPPSTTTFPSHRPLLPK
ncbi:hypothetical protein BofuT4_uP130930.1 [Botrytis cinerea T4]|uniref:Uncharacterized protein n=1 Tax=Botryotinia fuckeliana (strain T4) TaxID=999810 RepID=G2YQL5_BOTF4|nr:hypothetical protein BofuT4_uP130930.1 [Botrytis cinerea T4]